MVGTRPLIREIFYNGHQLFGSVMSATEASMVLRGLRTLPVRMEEHRRNAERVIDYLATRPEAAVVHHPYAEHGPDAEITARQFSGFSGLLSFELAEATFERVARFIDALSLFRTGVSWGGYESLVTSPLRPDNEAQLRAKGVPPGTVRLSVGLEGADRQIADLEAAFTTL